MYKELKSLWVSMYTNIEVLTKALEIYQDPGNWSVRSLLPEDIRDTDEWLGPVIPGYKIAGDTLLEIYDE
jgi:hypothetical protein